MIPKGQVKISIKKATDLRLRAVKKEMIRTEPEKYDENTPYNEIISYILDKLKVTH